MDSALNLPFAEWTEVSGSERLTPARAAFLFLTEFSSVCFFRAVPDGLLKVTGIMSITGGNSLLKPPS